VKQADDHPWRNGERRPRSGKHKHDGPGEISTEKLRAAFEKSGLSKCQLARRLGWLKTIGNVHRVNETLGYEKASHGKERQRVTYRTAVRLAKAMDADFFELGI